MNLPIIVANQLLNKLAILVQHFISHVGDVMEDSFIFNLKGKITITILKRSSCVKDFEALGIKEIKVRDRYSWSSNNDYLMK